MISELDDDELVEFLMTSDYEQDYKPEELKYMLLKFRNFYRVLYSKHSHIKDDKEILDKENEEQINFLTKQLKNKENDISNLESKIDKLKNRRLSFMERLSGKVKDI